MLFVSDLEDDKQALIDLIIWYRDKYHKKDFGHTEMIEAIKKCRYNFELHKYEQQLDSWLDW